MEAQQLKTTCRVFFLTNYNRFFIISLSIFILRDHPIPAVTSPCHSIELNCCYLKMMWTFDCDWASISLIILFTLSIEHQITPLNWSCRCSLCNFIRIAQLIEYFQWSDWCNCIQTYGTPSGVMEYMPISSIRVVSYSKPNIIYCVMFNWDGFGSYGTT